MYWEKEGNRVKKSWKKMIVICCILSMVIEGCPVYAISQQNMQSSEEKTEKVISDISDILDDETRSVVQTDKRKVEENPETAATINQWNESLEIAKGLSFRGAEKGNAIQLDSSMVKQACEDNLLVFNAARNGVYFLKSSNNGYYSNKADVIFYDLNTNTYETVYSYSELDKVYMTDDAVYFSKREMTALSEPVTEGDVTYRYNCDIIITKYDLNANKATEIKLDAILTNYFYISALGVDGRGRIYVSSNDSILYLFDSNGKKLDQLQYQGTLSEFYGFDDTNGNFYYRGYYNWRYWGYDHAMASLMAGNVAGGKISMPENNLSILYQSYFFEHEQPAAMLNSKYLGLLSTFSSDTLMLLDSNAYNYTDYSQQSTTINVLDSSVSVSMLNVKDSSIAKMTVSTAESEYEDNKDVTSVGPRCVLSSDGNSLIVKTDACTLTEYDIEGNSKKIQAIVSHPIYALGMHGDTCVVIEKENDNYYVETVRWQYPTDFKVEAPAAMKVGESAVINCKTDDVFNIDYTYESSNPKVAGIDEDGNLTAWKAGTVTIKIYSKVINCTRTVTITVSDSAISADSEIYNMKTTDGTVSGNMHYPYNNGMYGNTIDSHLTQLSNGYYERVELVKSDVVIETYDQSFALKTQKILNCELPLFGGFYSGENYNFLVFGQQNAGEKDSVEVIRVVKYDKSWKRIGACAIKGANTSVPFDAGGLSMAEKNGILYVHTCHEMYKSSDGYNHQANCTFCIQQSDMQLKDSYYDVMNLSYGYVSHSFMQYIKTDDTYIYRVDLGDAYPRAIAFTATKFDSKISRPSTYGSIMSIPGDYGSNYTGFALSGLEISDKYCIVVGNGIKDEDTEKANIWVTTVKKEDWKISGNWITNHENDNVSVMMPKLVKLNDNQFLLMWEESSIKSNKFITKMALLNQNGQLASDIYQTPLALSACDPIVNAKGQVVWYVTNGAEPIFIVINPYQLEKVQNASKNVTTFKIDNTSNWKKNANIGKVVKYKKLKYKITGLKSASLVGTTKKSITTITIPSTIKIKGQEYKVTAISNKACSGLKKLKKVSFGNNVTIIGKNAFRGCSKLSSVKIGSNVKTIHDGAFYKCIALKKLTIPGKVSKIGKQAFYGCKKLKSVTIKTSKLTSKNVGSKAFKGIDSKAKVKVPAKKLKQYKKLLKNKGINGKKQVIKK